jgi:hypothetical protein
MATKKKPKSRALVTPSLYEIRLPAGDSFGFDIGKRNENGTRVYHPNDWLSKGYAGVRFIGAGQGITHIRPASGVWTNIFVLQHQGTVQLENLTLHNGPRSAIQAGTGKASGLPIMRKFKLVTRGVTIDCSQPGSWGGFSYECDCDSEDLTIFGEQLFEHPWYHHQWAKGGALYERYRVIGARGECWKSRPNDLECRPVTGAHVVLRNFELSGWTTGGNRGCAGIVIQGMPGSNVLIEKGLLWGGPGVRCRCIMVDDGEGKATALGAPGSLTIRQVAAQGSSERTDYGDTLIRVGPLAGGAVASSLEIDRCSLWGANMAVQLSGIPTGKLVVKDSNTPAHRDWANAKGFDTRFEAQIPRPQRRVPVSEGLVA